MSFITLPCLNHPIDKNCPTQYAQRQKILRDEGCKLQLLVIVGLVITVVCVFFGMFKIDIPDVIMATVLVYFSYNAYRYGQNWCKIADTPKEFDSLFGSGCQRKSKLKKRLTENTFYFGIFVDFVVERVVNLKN